MKPFKQGIPIVILGSVILLGACLAAAGCVSGKTYRTQLHLEAPCEAGVPTDCPDDVLYVVRRKADTDRPPTLMGFVEFDDQGYPRAPKIKDQLIRELDHLANQRPLLIVVFAHGWKHNAAADDTNVDSFQTFLGKLSEADAAACQAADSSCKTRQVVGLYFGWRGRSNRWEPFNSLSFWARKGHAHRVGLDGASEVLAELSQIRGRVRPGNIQSANRLILTGHSFGGALIFTALNQALLRDIPLDNTRGVARNVADLIVIVNPAFEAARYQAIHRKSQQAFPSTQQPVLAIFTSQGDIATKLAFPAGRRVSTLFSEYSNDSQRSENVTAVGHYVPFQTHDLNVAEHQTPVGLRPTACAWHRFVHGDEEEWNAGGLVLRRQPTLAPSLSSTPYLNVAVDNKIVRGHNGIWEQEFSEFLYLFVASQQSNPDKC